jgi:uncharacterized protein YjcR
MGSDGDVRMTLVEASPLLGVKPATMRSWAKRRKLSRVGLRYTAGRPAAEYLWADLTRVEREVRTGSLTKGR